MRRVKNSDLANFGQYLSANNRHRSLGQINNPSMKTLSSLDFLSIDISFEVIHLILIEISALAYGEFFTVRILELYDSYVQIYEGPHLS